MMKPFVFAWVLLAVWFQPAAGQQVGSGKDVFRTGGYAINGYDPVAYFLENAAVKGVPQYSLEWNGAGWLFSNAQHLELFRKNPERYAPQYGGYCAYGASRGYKASTDPLAFTIAGNKLYLNYSPGVKQEWLKDTAQRIQLADAYWGTLQPGNH